MVHGAKHLVSLLLAAFADAQMCGSGSRRVRIQRSVLPGWPCAQYVTYKLMPVTPVGYAC